MRASQELREAFKQTHDELTRAQYWLDKTRSKENIGLAAYTLSKVVLKLFVALRLAIKEAGKEGHSPHWQGVEIVASAIQTFKLKPDELLTDVRIHEEVEALTK